MTANLQTVKAAFDEKDVRFTSFSVDPERDSVQSLKVFADRFGIGGNWQLLTGAKPVIYDLARNSLAVAAGKEDGSEADFIHSEKLVLIDANLKIRGYYNGTSAAAAQQLIQDIKKLKDEN